jgi:hypothetical protein
VPRRDCSARRGRATACDGAGGDQHATGRVSREQHHVPRKRAAEAPARLDRRSDDDELGATLGGDARDGLAEASRPRADDLAAHADPVRARDRGRRLEPLLQLGERAVEVGVQRQLPFEDGRGHEHDSRPAVGGEPAGKVERVLRLLPLEQRDDDGAVRDRLRPEREATGAPVQPPDVRQLHRMSW